MLAHYACRASSPGMQAGLGNHAYTGTEKHSCWLIQRSEGLLSCMARVLQDLVLAHTCHLDGEDDSWVTLVRKTWCSTSESAVQSWQAGSGGDGLVQADLRHGTWASGTKLLDQALGRRFRFL